MDDLNTQHQKYRDLEHDGAMRLRELPNSYLQSIADAALELAEGFSLDKIQELAAQVNSASNAQLQQNRIEQYNIQNLKRRLTEEIAAKTAEIEKLRRESEATNALTVKYYTQALDAQNIIINLDKKVAAMNRESAIAEAKLRELQSRIEISSFSPVEKLPEMRNIVLSDD